MSVAVQINGLNAAVERLREVEDAVSSDHLSMALRAVSFSIWGNILHRSPVDEGRYRAAWQPPDVSESEGLVEAVIKNNISYARPVTYGSVKGQRPWPRAGARTIEHGGRIYAKGGLASEELARGGVINPMMQKWADDVINKLLEGLE